jgi:hypothetical protein
VPPRKPKPRQEGDALVIVHGARLPAVCLKCGSHDEIAKRPTTFYWSPRWTRALMFCGVGLVISLLMREEAEIAIPLCPSCTARWAFARRAKVAAIVVAVLAFVGLRVTHSSRTTSQVVIGLVVLAVIAIVLLVRGRVLQVKRIDATNDLAPEVHLTGFDVAAAKELVE